MTEYIEKESLAKFISQVRRVLPHESKDFFTRDEMLLNFEQYVINTPSADVAPVKQGRWKYEQATINTLARVKCSICGWWSLDPSIDGAYHYCPNCGAKMDMEE